MTGGTRTLRQDPTFAIDQLVEYAIRALSPAVNDTFTAVTCIDWLSDGCAGVTVAWNLAAYTSTTPGNALIAAEASYNAVRRSGLRQDPPSRHAAMPAVMIRQLDALAEGDGVHVDTGRSGSVLLEPGGDSSTTERRSRAAHEIQEFVDTFDLRAPRKRTQHARRLQSVRGVRKVDEPSEGGGPRFGGAHRQRTIHLASCAMHGRAKLHGG